jgi:hypothetical protein
MFRQYIASTLIVSHTLKPPRHAADRKLIVKEQDQFGVLPLAVLDDKFQIRVIRIHRQSVTPITQ